MFNNKSSCGICLGYKIRGKYRYWETEEIIFTNWVCYSDKRVNEQMKYGSVSDPQIRPFFALIYSKSTNEN